MQKISMRFEQRQEAKKGERRCSSIPRRKFIEEIHRFATVEKENPESKNRELESVVANWERERDQIAGYISKDGTEIAAFLVETLQDSDSGLRFLLEFRPSML